MIFTHHFISKFQIFDFRERDMRFSLRLRCPHIYKKQRESDSYTRFIAMKRHERGTVTGLQGGTDKGGRAHCLPRPPPACSCTFGGPFAPSGRGRPSSLPSLDARSKPGTWGYHASKDMYFDFLFKTSDGGKKLYWEEQRSTHTHTSS